MKIVIETIPHEAQRYETVGDYWVDENGDLQVRISDMGDEDLAKLVAIHELWEFWICQHRGIKEPDIAAFDIEFEKKRKPGNEDEPGDDLMAPYKKEHCSATGVERLLAAELDVDWKTYEKVCTALSTIN